MGTHRNRASRSAMALLAGALALGRAAAQAPHQSTEEAKSPAKLPAADSGSLVRDLNLAPAAPTDGFWPSPKLMDLMLRRMADNVGSDFDLDDQQRKTFQDQVAKRWGTFLAESRSSIQPVFTDFLEMRLSLDPPTKERLQAWAERALPVLHDFRKQIDQGTDEFRGMLKPSQRAKFELHRFELAAGLAYAEAKLTQAQSGSINEEGLREFWEPTAADRKRARERKSIEAEEATAAAPKAKGAGEATAPPDQIAEELEGWDKYVADFIGTFQFDEGQRDAALSFLSELRLRATAHRDSHRGDINRLEQRIAAFNGTEAELADLRKQLTALYGPIDEMFTELKRRLDAIPTAHQRATVASRAPKDKDAPKAESPTKPASESPKP